MKNNISFDGFIQVCIVVKNIEKKVKEWAELFNVPVSEIRISEPNRSPKLIYRGEEAYYGQKIAVIQARGFVVELIEPTGGESTFQEYLDKHGEGVHHLGFAVGEKRDAIICEMEEMGYIVRTIGYGAVNSWTIMDTEEKLGVNLNIKPKG
jgi:hypothetical protein